MPEDKEYFLVDRVLRVNAQIADAATRAKTLGVKATFLQTLEALIVRLERDPLSVGEPAYRTHRPGGIVCHAISGMVGIQFAVFNEELIVLLLNVRLLTGSS